MNFKKKIQKIPKGIPKGVQRESKGITKGDDPEVLRITL